MKGLKRNLKYWMGTLEKQGICMLAYILVLGAFMAFMDEDGFIEAFNHLLPNYILMILFIFSFTNALNGINHYFLITIAMGSRRKSSFAAMQIAQHVVLLEMMAVYLLVLFTQNLHDRKELIGAALMTGLAAVFVLQAFGSLLSVVCVRFSRNIAVVVYVIVVVLGIGTLGLFILLFGRGTLTMEILLMDILNTPWLLFAGIILDAFMIGVFYAGICRNDLHFS